MAQVAHDVRYKPDIDYHLDYQFQAWKSVPEYAEAWPTMDATDKEVFHLEWVGMTESRLLDLQRWAGQGLLTPAQRERYQRLQRLVAQHRPTLERLLAD